MDDLLKALNQASGALRADLEQGANGTDFIETPQFEFEYFYDLNLKPGSAADYVHLGGVNQFREKYWRGLRTGGVLVAPKVMIGLDDRFGVSNRGRLYDRAGVGADFKVVDRHCLKDDDGSDSGLEMVQLEEDMSTHSNAYPVLAFPHDGSIHSWGGWIMSGRKQFTYCRQRRHSRDNTAIIYPNDLPIRFAGSLGFPLFTNVRREDGSYELLASGIHQSGTRGHFIGAFQVEIEAKCREWNVQPPKFVDNILEDLGINPFPEAPEEPLPPPPPIDASLPAWARLVDDVLYIHEIIVKRETKLGGFKYVRGNQDWPKTSEALPGGPPWARKDRGTFLLNGHLAQEATGARATSKIRGEWPIPRLGA